MIRCQASSSFQTHGSRKQSPKPGGGAAMTGLPGYFRQGDHVLAAGQALDLVQRLEARDAGIQEVAPTALGDRAAGEAAVLVGTARRGRQRDRPRLPVDAGRGSPRGPSAWCPRRCRGGCAGKRCGTPRPRSTGSDRSSSGRARSGRAGGGGQWACSILLCLVSSMTRAGQAGPLYRGFSRRQGASTRCQLSQANAVVRASASGIKVYGVRACPQ